MPPLPVKFDHLLRITDDTGVLEHCIGKVPRRKEGYSTDDNARVLWLCAEWTQYALRTNSTEHIPVLDSLRDTCLAFLLWVQGPDGRCHNNIAFDRTFEPESPSDDCQGRVLWAMAVTMAGQCPENRALICKEICYRGFQTVSQMRSPRGWALALAAASAMLLEARSRKVKGDWFFDWVAAEMPGIARELTGKLIESYRTSRKPGWHWFEPMLTYANAVLPWSLLHAYEATDDTEAFKVAMESLDFLITKMTAPQGHIRPIGNLGWCTPGRRSQWDQQPLEVMKLAAACGKAFDLTSDCRYFKVVDKCAAWFHGENDLGIALADSADGGCCDGLTATGPNINQGAESTISYLLTEAMYHNALIQGGYDHDHRSVAKHHSTARVS